MRYHTTLMLFFLFTVTLSAGDVQNFRLMDLENTPRRYSELKGEQLTVIDFWATWCKPCIRAIPKLNQLYDKFKDRGVQFIGINVDGPRSAAKVKPLARTLQISYPVVLDINNEIMNRLNVDAMPTLLLVDKDDRIVSMHRGYRPGDETLLAQEIEKLLADPDLEPHED